MSILDYNKQQFMRHVHSPDYKEMNRGFLTLSPELIKEAKTILRNLRQEDTINAVIEFPAEDIEKISYNTREEIEGSLSLLTSPDFEIYSKAILEQGFIDMPSLDYHEQKTILHCFVDGLDYEPMQEKVNDLLYSRGIPKGWVYSDKKRLITRYNTRGAFVEDPHDCIFTKVRG